MFETIWNVIVVFFWAFVFIAALVTLITIISDLFRDKSLAGWKKAIWLIFLVFVPLITALIYLIARGDGMADRNAKQIQQSQRAADDYIRSVAAASPTDEIAKAKQLLDSGTITAEEFNGIKAKALAA
ncbi:SHOCT domain-containing protein [Occultella kanbiaonis]|uniref:SHOCT domain-containing protein n=1 Tax=Occultella kanbiaonis TaxID=2675754 RepID=UPI001E40E970|nr:SHOCT domain-containing protein [Occultella kanbiaonis]